MAKAGVLCGVPSQHCTGAPIPPGAAAFMAPGAPKKFHPGGHRDAFKCHRRYLVKVEGYEQIGGREFRPPDGGPIRVLTKQIRFGCILRTGKEGRAMYGQKRNSGGVFGI